MIEDFLPNRASEKSVIIYGATIGGQVLYWSLKEFGIQVLFFCDEYTEEREFCGLPVKRISVLKEYSDIPIIIGVTRSFQSVYDTLKENKVCNPIFCGKYLVENYEIKQACFTTEELIRARMFSNQYAIYLNRFNQDNSSIVLPTLEVFITERCTLRCRDCSHMIFNYSKPKHHSIESIIKSLEYLLKFVEVRELLILGGEPLLHPQLEKLLNWCINNREKFRNITLITNGTLLLDPSIITLMKEGKVALRISDYGELSREKDKLQILCREEAIPCFTPKEKWVDFGRGEQHNYENEELKSMFYNCPFSHDYLLLSGRIYRCAHGAHLYRQKITTICNDDCIDLLDTTQDITKSFRNFFSLEHLSVCQFCNGVRYEDTLEPAIQME